MSTPEEYKNGRAARAVDKSLKDRPPQAAKPPSKEKNHNLSVSDFYGHMPTHTYLYIPTREMWPAASVDNRVWWPTVNGKPVRPSTWIDKHRPIEQMTWHPGQPELIEGRVIQISGWADREGVAFLTCTASPT